MTEEERQDLNPEELEEQEGEPLPERTQMSLIGHPGPVVPPGEITIPVVPPEAE